MKGKKYQRGIFIASILALFLASSALAAEEEFPNIVHPASLVPAIHGPRVTGATPGKPFLFLIPATGEKPITFSAGNLPKKLSLDPKTGIITGTVEKEGEYAVDLSVTNARGKTGRKLTIVAGKGKLALTPPMGWNSWNVWGLSVSTDKVKAAADAMVASGLASYGFQYLNIDDGWEKGRDPNSAQCKGKTRESDQCGQVGRDKDGKIITNEKFPDLKALGDYVHSRGLKLGIYSSPGPWTCGRYTGSYGHERQDAESYAEWGIDYLKYDWCSYSEVKWGWSLNYFQKPYQVMRKELDAVDRDIVFSLCQYGMKKVWTWGEGVGGNLWRTTGDISDNWISLSGIGSKQDQLAPYSGPGHWNDPDMLVVGQVGWGPTLHQTRLNKNEQITHITLWAMLAAPLLIGCEMTKLDQFTLALLTNDAVIDVDQDPLGKQAARIAQKGETEIWARPLYDGTIAVALFNKSAQKTEVSATWAELKLSGPQPVRDLWLQKDLGILDGAVSLPVFPHGALLLKVGKPKVQD